MQLQEIEEIERALYDPLRCQQWPRLPYVGAHTDATRRLKRGERQVFCARCARWRWNDQMCAGAKEGNNVT
jgi:hypothetical protein